MERKTFETMINASPERVWQILWGNDTYPQWTAVFAAGSNTVSDWKKGSKVLFLDGEGRGMVSRIADLRTNAYMSFEHLGEVTDGVEDTTSEKVKQWAGAFENYTLSQTNVGTNLTVDIDLQGEFVEMFSNMFPKALAKVKELAEQ